MVLEAGTAGAVGGPRDTNPARQATSEALGEHVAFTPPLAGPVLKGDEIEEESTGGEQAESDRRGDGSGGMGHQP